MKKLLYWITDYAYMVKGGLIMFYHRNPPQHYLGHIDKNKPPVILIPGIFGRWSFIKSIGDTISLAGHPVYVVPSLGYNLKNIPKSAEELEKIITKEALDNIVLVGYSKGGLIATYLLANSQFSKNILGAVTIATPHSGSKMAKLFPGSMFRDLDTDNTIITKLQTDKGFKDKVISIIPFYDNHVWSEKKSYLDGAKENIEVPVAGHSRVIFDNNVLRIVLESIEKFKK